jgi:hypothetical protein
MDRIAALRRIEQSLAGLEAGEADLDTCEREIRATVRTFATEFDGDLSAYRADSGLVVVAASEREARERVKTLTDIDAPTVQSIE